MNSRQVRTSATSLSILHQRLRIAFYGWALAAGIGIMLFAWLEPSTAGNGLGFLMTVMAVAGGFWVSRSFDLIGSRSVMRRFSFAMLGWVALFVILLIIAIFTRDSLLPLIWAALAVAAAIGLALLYFPRVDAGHSARNLSGSSGDLLQLVGEVDHLDADTASSILGWNRELLNEAERELLESNRIAIEYRGRNRRLSVVGVKGHEMNSSSDPG